MIISDDRRAGRALALTAITAAGLAAGIAAQVLDGPDWLRNGGFVAAYLAGGIPAARTALVALVRRRQLDIDLLMVAAALAAAAVGEPRDGAILLFLFSLANTLQDYAMGRARREVEALMALRPDIAHRRLPDGRVEDVAAEALVPGDVVVVRPGEHVPIDGTIVAGDSLIDESAVTGESLPLEKGAGASVFEATVNGHGVIEVRVVRAAADSTVARLVRLVTEAQARKAPSERFSDWFGQRYTVIVLSGSAVALAIFLAMGWSGGDALYRAATLLVAASPCAIVISVPAAILSALSASARGGVLFKGGAALETFGTVTQIAFDKTGTLTEGRPVVTEILPLAMNADELLGMLAGLEAHSEHLIAQGVRRAAQARGVAATDVADVAALPGEGISGRDGEGAIWAGNQRLAARMGAAPDEATMQRIRRLSEEGHTVILVGRGDGLLGAIALADRVRDTARSAVAALREAGVARIAMMTGDHRPVAVRIAHVLGIPERDVAADLMPADKVARVQAMRHEGTLAFVGDGVNDAAALASADVGVAIGTAGSDVALEAADVALLSEDLGRLEQAHRLARRANRIIRQNLAFAVVAMISLVVLTLFFDLSLPLAVVGHEGGTLVVVFNGMRLLFDPMRTGAVGAGGLPARSPAA